MQRTESDRAGGRRHRAGTGRAVVTLAATAAVLAGCGHRDPVDTPVNWWHQLEGGAIAQLRPPPPGVDDPYPKVGTTPAKPPVLLSPQLRASLTEQLIEQRNLSVRLNANEPLPPAVVVAPKPPAAATPAPAASSATLDAAEAPPPPAAPAAASASSSASASAAAGKPADNEPELAMPAVVAPGDSVVVASGPIPAIPDAPPAPPGLPGIAMPPPPRSVAPPHPDYLLRPPPGQSLQFPPGSDALSPGQDATMRQLATSRGAAGIIYVHGYGDASSDAPSDQAQALTLASLRARSIADALHQHGVPESAIRLRADAFGRGASAGLID